MAAESGAAEKVLRQMIAASSGFYITAAEVAVVLQNEMRKVSALPPAVDLSGTLEDIERRVIEQCCGRRT